MCMCVPDLKQRLHMLNELSCAVVMAVGVDRMVPNHNLPLSLRPGQPALQLKQVALPRLLHHAPCMQPVMCLLTQPLSFLITAAMTVTLAVVMIVTIGLFIVQAQSLSP